MRRWMPASAAPHAEDSGPTRVSIAVTNLGPAATAEVSGAARHRPRGERHRSATRRAVRGGQHDAAARSDARGPRCARISGPPFVANHYSVLDAAACSWRTGTAGGRRRVTMDRCPRVNTMSDAPAGDSED